MFKRKITNISAALVVLIALIIVGAFLGINKPQIENPHYGIDDFTQITDAGSGWDFHSRISNDGQKICFARYDPTTARTTLNIYSIIDDNITTIVSNMTGDCAGTWSPDDSQIAFDARANDDAISYIYIVTLENGNIERFSSIEGNSFRPTWSHDGLNIAYIHMSQLYIQSIEDETVIPVPNANSVTNPSWNHDDSQILFSMENSEQDIYVINLDGTNLKLLAEGNSADLEGWARWNNQSSQVVFHLYDELVCSVAIKDLETNIITVVAELGDCRFPDWSPDGNFIVFSYDDNLWIFQFKNQN